MDSSNSSDTEWIGDIIMIGFEIIGAVIQFISDFEQNIRIIM